MHHYTFCALFHFFCAVCCTYRMYRSSLAEHLAIANAGFEGYGLCCIILKFINDS